MQYAPIGHQHNVFVLSFQHRIEVNAGNAFLAYARKVITGLQLPKIKLKDGIPRSNASYLVVLSAHLSEIEILLHHCLLFATNTSTHQHGLTIHNKHIHYYD